MRINKVMLVIGLGMAALAVLGLLFAGRLLNPPPTQVPVAIQDIVVGAPLDPSLFRLEEWQGVRAETLRALYLPDDFPSSAVALVDIPAGSPLYKAYVDTEHNREFVTRMSNLVKDAGLVVMAIPVEPDTGGNIPQPGDQVDLVFSTGILRVDEMQSHPTPTPSLPRFGQPVSGTVQTQVVATRTLPLPMSALVLENLPVLNVEYKQVTTAARSSSATGETTQPVVQRGPAERLYVAVTRAQAEMLGFLLHNGDVLLAVHQGGVSPHYPGGLTWQDFETTFFERRPLPTPTPVTPPGGQG